MRATKINLDVDAIYVITIKGRLDRQEYMEKNLLKYFPEMQFWVVKKDVENPVRGCFNSHREIALQALERRYKNVLIFEDDAVLYKNPSPAAVKAVNNALQRRGFDIFYLGGILGEIWLKGKLGIVGANLWCTHAYILSDSGVERLVNQPFAGFPIDYIYKRDFKSLAVFPLWFTQLLDHSNPTDIQSHDRQCKELANDLWGKNQRSQLHRLMIGTFIRFFRFKK